MSLLLLLAGATTGVQVDPCTVFTYDGAGSDGTYAGAGTAFTYTDPGSGFTYCE